MTLNNLIGIPKIAACAELVSGLRQRKSIKERSEGWLVS